MVILLRKVQNILSRTPLVTIYKSIRTLLDYRDISHENLELIQYNAALAITDATRASSREKIYQELGFESLQQRQ